MAYSKVKVYSDGGHYIGIPYEPNPHAGKRHRATEEAITVTEQPAADNPSAATAADSDIDIAVGCEPVTIDKERDATAVPTQRQMTRKKLFDELYLKSADMKTRERKALIQKEMLPYFKDSTACQTFVERNFERKKRNMICRKIRLWRKINQQWFNFFATFTYSDTLHTEESFKKALSGCLQHFSARKGWRYIGVWERATETKRLHFHGIFYIPEGTLAGKNEEVRDFDTRARKMHTTNQNDFFGNRFYFVRSCVPAERFKPSLGIPKIIRKSITVRSRFLQRWESQITLSCSCSALSKRHTVCSFAPMRAKHSYSSIFSRA